MKLIHLSDLHLGKRVNEFSMIEDQGYILGQILGIIDEETPDGVLIAGDVYDKSVPSAEAVKLCNDFLVALAKRELPVFLSSGNHDSAERLAFGRELLDASGIHISPVYQGTITPVTLTDEHGEVDIYMLPFVKPAAVRHVLPEAEIESYTDAVRTALEQIAPVPGRRNVLLAHQFVTGAATCESEEISVGGSENVNASVFDAFDYVALGHLHGPQNVGERIRYCGTPLKYSFSEVKHSKSVTVVELGEKGELSIRTAALKPLREMVELRGSFAELTDRAFYEGTTYQSDYVRVILTDEEELPDSMGKLRQIYPNMMRFEYDNRRTRSNRTVFADGEVRKRSPLEEFADLFAQQNNQPMSETQKAFMEGLIEKIWGVAP